MSTLPDDIESRRLHNELEHTIKSINGDLISAATGPISRQGFTNVARMVGCLRARYLATVLTLGNECHSNCIDTQSALALKQLREAYTEAMEGFAALEHALKRGYITLSG